jgi:hypothetical protein
MKGLTAALLGIFAILTDPRGADLYIVKSQVVGVSKPAGECAPDTHAKVFTTAGAFCVAEDPADVKRKVDEQ